MKNYQHTLILEERNSEQKMEWKIVHNHFSKIQIFHSIVCILQTITSFWLHKNHISTKAHMELALKFVYKTGLLLQKVPKLSASSIHVGCIKCKLEALFQKKKIVYLQNLGNCVLNQNSHKIQKFSDDKLHSLSYQVVILKETVTKLEPTKMGT